MAHLYEFEVRALDQNTLKVGEGYNKPRDRARVQQ